VMNFRLVEIVYFLVENEIILKLSDKCSGNMTTPY
jgi:hypothetical protein